MSNIDVTLGPGDRILVSRLDYLGDVLLSLPLCDALRERWPGVTVDYLTRRPAADLIAADPRFEAVFTAERGAGLVRNLTLIQRLRARGYSAVLDLYANPRSAWLSWFTGAGIRIGADRRGRRHLYTNPIHVPESVRAATAIYRSYGAPLGVSATPPGKPMLTATAVDVTEGEAALARAGATEGLRVGIHPGGKWTVKRWATSSFASLVRLIRDRTGATVVVLTGPGEEVHSERLQAMVGDDAKVIPTLGIRTVAGLMSHLDAMIVCDGGIMHLAVALGVPTVAVFGSSEPDIWFPYDGLGPFRSAVREMSCRPCHEHTCPLGHNGCLNDLSAETVFDLLENVLADARGEQNDR